DFLDQLQVAPMAEQDVVENQVPLEADPDFAARFDKTLAGATSKLTAYTSGGEALVAECVRETLGLSAKQLPDDEAIATVLDPARNPHLLDTLNTWTHSPLMRSLNHVTYTFRKKLSHTADSQDQRHRMVPASRPLLTRTHTRAPDYLTPDLIREVPEALALYDRTMAALWDAKNQLLAMGARAELALYVLPNAAAVRFTSTGSLLHQLHKWRMRTCFNAQREIYEASMEELAQVREVHPRLAQHIGPPCLWREGLVANDALKGPCPEPVWCGVQVWRNFPKVKRVV
ncbi:MAG TPA: FAD-dependent thymidylate synthase, partial [Candidatus Thermoplasmatota archaeon]|nr:FAD-dependent thymidylate synthase [Candidatus Thermoplasmatota archaeon]